MKIRKQKKLWGKKGERKVMGRKVWENGKVNEIYLIIGQY